MVKFFKILLVIIWMSPIFILSSIPAKSFPAGTTNFEEILAHIFLYAILGYLIYQAAISFTDKTAVWKIIFLSLFLVALYGISDEYHQGYVPGRFVSFTDLGFDIFGGFVGVILYGLIRGKKPKLLLHICCAGCGIYISQLLKQGFNLSLFFYNPNIYPNDEYEKRKMQAGKLAKEYGLKIIYGEYDHELWLYKIKGHEADRERGERCKICYKLRLEKTAETTKAKGFKIFATTLTVSPHKDAVKINEAGVQLAEKYNIKFLAEDFKKRDGFKKSCVLSKKLGLYRQDYCGCEYSKNQKSNTKYQK